MMMRKFDLIDRGYNPSQVDAYLSILTKKYEERIAEISNETYALKNELEKSKMKIADVEQKERQISKAFISAVEKAEEIENQAKEIARRELDNLRSMYEKWEILLAEAEGKASMNGDSTPIKEAIASFQQNIKDYNIESLQDNASIKEHLKKNSNDYVRNILNKMDYLFFGQDKKKEETGRIAVSAHLNSSKQNVEVQAKNEINGKERQKTTIQKVDMSEALSEHVKENNRIASIGGRLQNLNKQVKKVKGDSLAEQFLNSEEVEANAYAKTFQKKKAKPKELEFAYPEPNESGFDLKEALNPHDNLDTIMSAFDFYEPNKK